MSTYVNFGNQYNSSTYTTLAVGEEGGERATTLAVGEEGGGYEIPNDPLASKRTQDYLSFLREADGFMGDGRLTREEITRHINHLENLMGFLKQISDIYSVFFPQARTMFERAIEGIASKIKVGERLLSNYNTFAQGSPDGPRPGDDSSSISAYDVWYLAGRDGNFGDISDDDLRRYPYLQTAAPADAGNTPQNQVVQ